MFNHKKARSVGSSRLIHFYLMDHLGSVLLVERFIARRLLHVMETLFSRARGRMRDFEGQTFNEGKLQGRSEEEASIATLSRSLCILQFPIHA